MTEFPGWFQDPTGRHPERYFDDDGIPTQLVRSDGLEFLDVGPNINLDATIVPPSQPIPLASYRASAGDQYHWPRATGSRPAPEQPAAPVEGFLRRTWVFLGVIVLLVVLLGAAVFTAVQEHQDANRWQSRFGAEVGKYQSQVRKNVVLYATLVTTQQQLLAATSQRNKP